ncbi:MAG: family 16 glycoside hydrolase [Isosphaeraceae bacterium]
MNRLIQGLAACVVVAALAAGARAQTPAELAQTARFVAAFQNPDGGFAGKVGGESTLGSTSSAARILKYCGGSIPDVLGAIKFVKTCVDPATGGFAQRPGGKPDVPTTASGLMALGELKVDDKAMVDAAVGYLVKNAHAFEEIRIAVAGLEAVKRTDPVFAEWEKVVTAGQNDDGTFGAGASLPRDTGGKNVALLRMGKTLEKKDAIAASLRKAQTADGVWGREEGKPDLETTYRIMRFFHMTHESPDLDKVRGYLAKRRHSDGSYSPAPGAESNLGATYFASIILYWSRLLGGEPAQVETAGFRSLFNGTDLSGWEGERSLWLAQNGELVGNSPGIKQNQFLASELSYRDFVLKLTFKLEKAEGNSGVQFRSVRVPGTEMSGYQADIGENYWGCLYDESRRNKTLVKASDAALKALHKDAWNQYVIDAKGPDIRLALNGATSVQYKETEPGIAADGRLAVQIHAGGPMRVRFKDIYIQPVPTPTPEGEGSPGFYLRELATPSGTRKFTVYIPTSYDGKKPVPVVLFLHGSGERGEDGVKSAQTGIGPAILAQKDTFQAIAVIPQARQTWAAGSDDAKAALAVLDAVMKEFKTDPNKVVITGLSMGGRGAWEIAAAEPDRFAAVVPVCGIGKTESAPRYGKTPVWAFVGDADRDATVHNGRAMVEAIKAAGGNARLTEYRGVGHNSWDRAYNDPSLIDWIQSQTRR